MTQEDETLLMKDLCGRIPYDTVVNVKQYRDAYLASVNWWGEIGVKDYTTTLYPLEDVKPYLRPMSSMTEDEERELEETLQYTQYTLESYDWLNQHHFDYRGLIEKGLALEASEQTYK